MPVYSRAVNGIEFEQDRPTVVLGYTSKQVCVPSGLFLNPLILNFWSSGLKVFRGPLCNRLRALAWSRHCWPRRPIYTSLHTQK